MMDKISKQKILDSIMASPYVPIFKKVSGIRYRIRCPICGDSQKDSKDSHCYIKCSDDPNEPLLYKCFLCNAKGMVNEEFLKMLQIRGDVLDLVKTQRYNKVKTIKESSVEIITGSPNIDSPQVRYIESRLGKGLNIDDYNRFKIIWDMSLVVPFISDKRELNMLPSNRNTISFLSDDKRMLLSRGFDTDSKWRKISIVQSDDKSFFTIKTMLNLFSEDSISINIAEGIFDILSIYKNFNDGENSVFIAVLGSDYASGIDYAIMKGIIGLNVNVKIYVDADQDVNKIKKQMKKLKWLFNKITLFRNSKSKDVGVKIGNINLIEDKV